MRHRILFYSHDSFGLGHFRRSLTIASFLARHIDNLAILMVTSIDSPASFEVPRGIDFVRLPAIWKSGPEEYRSRHLRVSFNRVKRMREYLVRTVARSFDPTLLVVDNVPRGMDGELLSTLRYLRRQRPTTKIVLTMRDVLDRPEAIIEAWRRDGIQEVLRRFYDEIWIAGCQEIFDPVALYDFLPDVARLVRYCGYVVRSVPEQTPERLRREMRLGSGPVVVASCGGGGDGFPLLNTFVDAAAPLADDGVQSVVFIGPDMAPGERRRLKEKLLPMSERFLTFDFRPDLVSFLALASASVSMGGYNTMSEIAALRPPAVVVPRVYPREEQVLRARAFAQRGLVRVLHPDRLDAASLRGELRHLLATRVDSKSRTQPPEMDFAGLSRIARRVRKHLGLTEEC